jgi:hypothetical protein
MALALSRICPAWRWPPGDLVVANDAATLPASPNGVHRSSGEPIEVRLAGWVSFRDPTHFVAVAFGAGYHCMLTEDRPPPSQLSAGDRLELGPLIASVERLLDHPRLLHISFAGSPGSVMRDLVRHGQPIQYAHIPEPLMLWNVWTKIAANPIAFESPSAGFALDCRTLKEWRERGGRFRDPLARGRSIVDRRRRPRPAAPLRRLLLHSEGVRDGDQGHEVEVTARHRDRDQRRKGARICRQRRRDCARGRGTRTWTHHTRRVAPCCGHDAHRRPPTRGEPL